MSETDETTGREWAPGPAEDVREHAPASAEELADELLRLVAEDNRLTATAQRLPAAHLRRSLANCRTENAEALRAAVGAYGWPTADLVGPDASTAALMILLHSDDLPFQLTCRALVTEAVGLGLCSPIHGAYLTDHCAVALGQPQSYGTKYTPLGRPYPVLDPEGVDARRLAIGLRTMAAEQQALREMQLRHLTSRASA
ncbi:DUF6624 domain-containing protein [Streptomyces sp. NPDC088725]|uniref:DUF6624 domain-containing protein n=1 Tax=Streptomyces sp. NPDC088725 TaxID=3365873 RepID=UPI00380A7568